MKFLKRRATSEATTQTDSAELQQIIIKQARTIERCSVEIQLLRRTAESLGAELERIIAQPEGSDEHLAATWWRDQYEALTEQVRLHLAQYHAGMDAL